MMKIFIFSVAAAAILTAGVSVDTSTGGSSKKASSTQDTTDKQTSESSSASESSTKTTSKTKTSTSTKETANTKTTSTSSTKTKTSSASFSMGVKTPLTAIWQMPVEHMTFGQKNVNDAFNGLSEKLSVIQSDGVINESDWQPLYSVLTPHTGGTFTGESGEREYLFYLFSYPMMVPVISVPKNETNKNQIQMFTSGRVVFRTGGGFSVQTITENGMGQSTVNTPNLSLVAGEQQFVAETNLMLRYAGYLSGKTIIKEGQLTTFATTKGGEKIEVTTEPRHLLISKSGRTIKEYSNDLYREEKENVLVALSSDNYSVVWNNNKKRPEKVYVLDGFDDYGLKQRETANNSLYSYTNSPEYYCTLIENAKKIQREKGLSVSEIAMRLKDMMPTTNAGFATCQQQPKIGDVMFDRKANIVFNRSIEINAVSDETVSDAYASMFQNAKTEKFADAVQRAVAFLESKGRTTEANAMRSMAVKSTTSKSFDKVQEATFSAKTVSEFFEALKK